MGTVIPFRRNRRLRARVPQEWQSASTEPDTNAWSCASNERLRDSGCVDRPPFTTDIRRRTRRARCILLLWAGFCLVIGWWVVSLWFLICALFARQILEREMSHH